MLTVEWLDRQSSLSLHVKLCELFAVVVKSPFTSDLNEVVETNGFPVVNGAAEAV